MDGNKNNNRNGNKSDREIFVKPEQRWVSPTSVIII
jgi:hypothetical protein